MCPRAYNRRPASDITASRELHHVFAERAVYLTDTRAIERSIFNMLLLSAILRISVPPETAPNDLLAEARLRLGHVGLTIIALVFVLVSFWRH